MATAAGALKDQREREQRETELQAIIKTQESKIQSLKREISLIKEQD